MTTLRNLKPSTLAIGAAGVIGIVFLARKAKAAQAPNASKSSTTKLPASSPPAPRPPQLPANTSASADVDAAASLDITEIQLEGDPAPARKPAQEGAPLAWDLREHPLASNAAPDRDFPPEVKIVVDVPAPSAPKPSSSKPSASAKTKAKPPVPKPPAAKPAPKSAPAEVIPRPGRTPQAAAQELYELATSLLKAGKGSMLGTGAAPSTRVLELQQGMGSIAADGIYGPGTRARGKQLIGKNFPVRK